MAKQKYEITAFTKGIIGSPSETDIPEDAASYSVNIDPNAEDGTLRGINKDSILDKSGFKQSSSDGIAQVTLQIKRSAAATDNGSSTYNYNDSFFFLVSSDLREDNPSIENLNIIDYFWFDQAGTTPNNTDPVPVLFGDTFGDSENISGSLRNGYQIDIAADATIQNIRDAIYDVIPATDWSKEKVSTDQIKITSVKPGAVNIFDGSVYLGKQSSGKITVNDGDDSAQQPAELDYYQLIDHEAATYKYVFVDKAEADTVATGTVLAEGSDYGSDTLEAGHALIGGIAVSGNITTTGGATQYTQYQWLSELKTAIEGSIQGSSFSFDLPTAAANGNQHLTITMSQHGAYNTTITESVGNSAYTKTDFSGGVQSLIDNDGSADVITATTNDTGTGVFFPVNNFALLNRGSSSQDSQDSGKTIYDAIGVNYANNNIFKIEDIYANNSSENSGLQELKPNINHNSESTFVVRNKNMYIGLGNTKESMSRWVGWIDNTQFNKTLTGYYSEESALTNIDESAAPMNLDYIVSFPFTYDADDANMIAFSGIQGWHADVANMSGNDLDYQMFNASGLLYSIGDNDTQDINQYGKLNNSTPKIGWCFRISSAHDTSDGKLLAAKKAYYDANASIAAGDIFQIADIGTSGADDTKLNYIGNCVDATPDGNSGAIGFSYGIVEGSKYLYRVSMTTTADTSAFTTSNVSRYMKYDISHIIGDSGIATIATCMTPVTVGASKVNSEYFTYGDGTMDALSMSQQNIRGLHSFLWISNNEGELFRINIQDLDSQNSDETYSGVKLDYKVNFDYSNIAKCNTSSDDGTFKHWFGAIHKATEAEKYLGTKSTQDTGRNISNTGGGATWDDNISWTKDPQAAKIVGICETQTNRGYKSSDSLCMKRNGLGGDEYVYQLSESNSGPLSTNGIAHQFGTTTDYTWFSDDGTAELRIEKHGLDVGDIVTIYMLPSSDITDSSKDDMLGNTIVARVHDENHISIPGDPTGSGIDYDKMGFYLSKVWVLFAKQDPNASFERWDLFLYNFNPATISSNEKAVMYDRTPPYTELGINKYSGITTSTNNPFYNSSLSGDTAEVGIDKETVLWYDAENSSESYNDTSLSGTWRSQNFSWTTTNNKHFRMSAYKRRDGTVVANQHAPNEFDLQHLSYGHNAGWYGDDTDPNYRKVIPQSHTLQPMSIRDYNLTQNVSFLGKVTGKFSTRPGVIYRRGTEGSDHVLPVSNKWDTYNNDLCLFTINDHGGASNGYSLTYGNTYKDGKGHSYSDSNTGTYITHESNHTSYYTLTVDSSGSFDSGDTWASNGSEDRCSHYFSGGRYKNNTNIGGYTGLTYNGTQMTDTIVPYCNATSGTVYQGQIGDYLFIDRKWLSIDPDVSNNRTLDGLRISSTIFESENVDTALYTRFSNEVRFATGTSLVQTNGMDVDIYSDTGGYASSSRPSVSVYPSYPWNTRPVLSSQAQWISATHKSSGSNLHGPYKFDARQYAPSFGTLHYQGGCKMRRLEYSSFQYDKIRHAKFSYISEIDDKNSATNVPAASTASGDYNYQPNEYTIDGYHNYLYLISAVISSGITEKSAIAAYRAYDYAYYPLTPTEAVDEYYNAYAHYANQSLCALQSYAEYSDVPKLVFNNSKFAGKHWQDSTNFYAQDGFLLTGNRLGTTADASNKQFTIRGDDVSGTDGSWTWQWEDTPNDGFMVGGTFEAIDNAAAGSNMLLEGDSLLTITNNESGTSEEFPANGNVRYKISLLYDGHQESPLSTFFWDKDIGSTSQKSVSVKISVQDPSVFKSRVTHMIIYRRVGDNTLYRMVKEVPLDEGWVFTNGIFTYTFIDNHRTGSYEALTGISEETEETHVNYTLSCEINDELFVANCYSDSVEKGDARRYIYKSKPGNYSQFDTSKDYIILKTIPTALVSFNGRIYAFDRSNTYKINPDGMYVEDTYEGVGCLSQNAVAVSEFGMCFCDSNNVYLHDGNTPIQIANNILNISTLEGFKVGYQKAVENTEDNNNEKPKIFYDGKANSFVVFLVGTCTQTCSNEVSRAYAYNLARKRWDYWEAPLCKQAVSGQDSDILISNGDLVYNYKDSTDYRSWEFRTKQLSLSQLGNNKRFHRVKVFGAPNISDDNVTTASDPLNDNIVVLVDGVPQDITLENIRYEKSFMGAKMAGTINNTEDTSTITFDSATGDAPLKGSGGAKYPVVDNYIQVDDEIMKITSVSTSTMIVSRAKLGTTKAAHTNSRLYYIAPSVKLPSKCKGKKIEIHLKSQSGIVDGIGIDFINKGNG